MKKPDFNFNQESGTGLFPSNSTCSLVVWSLMKLETVIDVLTIVRVLKGLINGSMAISNTRTASSGKPRGERTMLSIVKVRTPESPDVAIPAKIDPAISIKISPNPREVWYSEETKIVAIAK